MPVPTILRLPRPSVLSFVSVAFSLSGCGGDAGDSLGPGDASDTGSLTVAASTTGSEIDSDGYTVTVDAAGEGALNGNVVTVSGMAPGDHSVGLSGVADNCQVQGDNPLLVTISPGAAASVTFDIVCTTPPPEAGSIQITATTSGPDPDPDGYFVQLDGIEPGVSVPATGSASFPSVVVGSHSLTLSGLASNCSVAGGSTNITTTVSSEAPSVVSFAVDCVGLTPTTGLLRVTTSTTGQDRDGNGYRF